MNFLELALVDRNARDLADRPLRPSKNAHRSIVRSGRSKSAAITHRATMATTMGLPKLSELTVITTTLLPQESSYDDYANE